MLASLLMTGGFSLSFAQRQMSISQLFGKIEENSKALRVSKSGVESAAEGLESAKSKRLPDIDASLSFS